MLIHTTQQPYMRGMWNLERIHVRMRHASASSIPMNATPCHRALQLVIHVHMHACMHEITYRYVAIMDCHTDCFDDLAQNNLSRHKPA